MSEVCEQCENSFPDEKLITYEFGEVEKDMTVCHDCHEGIVNAISNGAH